MAPTRAGILTTSGKVIKFDAPSRTCVTFSSCSGWEAAEKLLYARVPDGQSVAFFREEDCAGNFVFNSDVGKAFGNEIVKGDKAVVRSFILAKYTTYPVKGIVSMCRDESALVLKATEGSDDDMEWTMSSSATNGGNLSTNWFDPLSEGGIAVGDA
ncbi:hypothetical protein PHYSODRAFT_262469 [Phytophthora sojae]|uniref:Uncharacterized protein n=1 Tax=Phytophthora sojae (strain P6497) TaxID=1094619 RepID=G4ZHF6_PHYSP|nr:hypothetical protein PHYSODRAFT_262469 [Phytophthora sojae]EGZ17626.1 hypothetical protein PHYSODRAFT_262469 [Phytophthora sojae]|eukprot:XP_009526684.1 hypothetical protein PHYSODRAFT_262469 [Phytophthora sojae]